METPVNCQWKIVNCATEECNGNDVAIWSWSSWPLWVSIHLCCFEYLYLCAFTKLCALFVHADTAQNSNEVACAQPGHFSPEETRSGKFW